MLSSLSLSVYLVLIKTSSNSIDFLYDLTIRIVPAVSCNRTCSVCPKPLRPHSSVFCSMGRLNPVSSVPACIIYRDLALPT